MKKTMKKPKKDVEVDINGENTYEELEKGTPAPPPIKSSDELMDEGFALFLQIEKHLGNKPK